MDLTHIGAFFLGAAVYGGFLDYILPALKRRNAIKARIAKATATRRANAVRKAATGEGNHG